MEKIFLFTFVLFLACKEANVHKDSSKNTTENTTYVESIKFSEYNPSVPADFDLYEYRSIEVEKDSVRLIQYTYKRGVLTQRSELNSYENKSENERFFATIPEGYLLKNQVFGTLETEADGGAIQALVSTTEKDSIVWKISLRKETLPKDIQFVHTYYTKLKSKLYQ